MNSRIGRSLLFVFAASSTLAWTSAAGAAPPRTANAQPRAAATNVIGPSDRPSSSEHEEAEPPEHFRVGALFGLGFPRPLAVEAFSKFERIVGAGIEYSFLPRTTVGNADAGFDAVALDLRLFPFKNSFFVGLRGGRQWLGASARISAGRYGTITESMQAATWFLNPRLGVLHTFGSGITLGIDAGVQVPIGATYERNGPATAMGIASQYEVDGVLVEVANALGNRTTLTIDLLRVGFLF